MAWKTTKVASHHSKERNQTDRRGERGGDVKQTSKGKVGGSISFLPAAKMEGRGQSIVQMTIAFLGKCKWLRCPVQNVRNHKLK